MDDECGFGIMASAVKINLLPWRQQQRQQQLRTFLLSLAGILSLLVFLLFGLRLMLMQKINTAKNYNLLLKQQVIDLQRQVKKLEISQGQVLQQEKMAEITKDKEVEQRQWLNFLISLKHDLPRGIYLTQIKKNNNVMELIGRAQSQSDIALFLQRISRDKKEVKLININREKTNDTLFSCQVLLNYNDNVIHEAH